MIRLPEHIRWWLWLLLSVVLLFVVLFTTEVIAYPWHWDAATIRAAAVLCIPSIFIYIIIIIAFKVFK